MTLYIVRHGESEGNAQNIHSTHETSLTEEGKKQAKQVGNRFRSIKLDQIICSTTLRTRQTLSHMFATPPAPVIYDEQFCEQSRPSQIRGLPHAHPLSLQVMDQIERHADDPDWHYSDEENNFDFLRKIDGALRSLERFHDRDQVLLVAHGHVLRAIVGIVLFAKDFSARDFDRFTKGAVITKNTGVTIVRFSPERGWQLVTFNDHAHLLE